jgi:hypothetical protein
MGAPGIESGHPEFTVTYYGPLGATKVTRFQVFHLTTAYWVPLRPPTYEPPTGHPYKCPGGQL